MRKSTPHWWAEDSASSECGWVFRGHWNGDWKLVPSAGREQYHENDPFRKILEGLDRQITAKYPQWIDCETNRKAFILRLWAYIISVERFIKLGTDLNFKLNPLSHLKFDFIDGIGGILNSGNVTGTDTGFIPAFRASFYHLIFDFQNYSSIALVQHHRVPTLDNVAEASFNALANELGS